MASRLKYMFAIMKALKEVTHMIFTQQSSLVRSYSILILAGQMTYDEVPAVFNLREEVAIYLGLEEAVEAE